MKVLHICSYYFTSKVYARLFHQQGLVGMENTIFVATKDKFKECEAIDGLIVSNCLRRWMKISLFIKSFLSLLSLVKKIGFSGVKSHDVIHCHTLFSDGLLGLFLYLTTGRPYIVTVRNTDFNQYLKYFPHLRFVAQLIMSKSQLIVFISPSYLVKFRRKYPWINDYKVDVITNGVDDFWLDNQSLSNASHSECINVISVGYFDKNKNFGLSYLSTQKLVSSGLNVHHYFVGGDKSKFEEVYDIKVDNKLASFLGVINDLDKLKDLYSKSSVLLVPSHNETFGLVYIEALSQGLSVVCSRGQGIDGIFDESLNKVFFCDSTDLNSIYDATLDAVNSLHCSRGLLSLDMFSWSVISKKYFNIYRAI